MYSFSGNCTASVPISTFINIYSVHILSFSRIDRPILKYINLSQIYECRNWETVHYNSVLEITVSFLGILNWEPDIYIGFSPALHLQCMFVQCPRCSTKYLLGKKCLRVIYRVLFCGETSIISTFMCL
jgi:hypothetical protein